MHDLEPFGGWRYLYDQDQDRLSPLYGQGLTEMGYHLLYDHVIHPNWDSMGSETLYVKILYIDDHLGFAVIEMIGEWNDAIGNDIMWLKRELIDPVLKRGIQKFILLGNNVLNYYGDEDAYYEEWSEDSPGRMGHWYGFQIPYYRGMGEIGAFEVYALWGGLD